MQINSSFKQVIQTHTSYLIVVSIVEDVPEVSLHVSEALHVVAVVHGSHLPRPAQVTRQNVPAVLKD